MQVEFMRFDCNQECIELGYTISHFGGIRFMYDGNPIRPKRSRMLRMQFSFFSVLSFVCNAEPRTVIQGAKIYK